MTTDSNAYNITISRTEIAGEKVFEARVAELPGITGYGESAAEAHAIAVEAIDALQEMAANDGDKLPPPIQRDLECSGRITLRMSPMLHRLAKLTAETEDLTLNALLCERLALSLGMTAGHHAHRILKKITVENMYDFTYANTTTTQGIQLMVIRASEIQNGSSPSPNAAVATVAGFAPEPTTGRFSGMDFSSQEAETV
jgi:predicted HicB family RNase H-like nuclease